METLSTLHANAQRDPGDAQAWFALGMSLLAHVQSDRTGSSRTSRADRAAAIAALLHARERPDLSVETRLGLGRAFAALGLDDEADAEVAAVLAAHESAEAHRLSASIKRRRKQYEPALASARRAIELGDDAVATWRLVIEVLRALDRPDEALKEAETAITRYPSDLKLLRTVADLAGQHGQDELCLSAWKRARDLEPGDTRIATAHATALLLSGREEEALVAFREVVRLVPLKIPARLNLIDALQKLERHADAEAAATKALEEVDSRSVDLRLALARAQRGQGKVHEAVDVVEALREGAEERADVWFTLGQLREETGARAEALEAFREATRIEPEHEGANEALSRLSRRRSSPDTPATTSVFGGSLDTFSVADCLEFLRQQRSTGILFLHHDQDGADAELTVRSGELLWVELEGLPTLENFLSGSIEAGHEARIEACQDAHDLRALEDEEIISAATADAFRMTRLTSALDSILDWADGTFALERAKDMTRFFHLPGKSISHAMMETLRLRDERER